MNTTLNHAPPMLLGLLLKSALLLSAAALASFLLRRSSAATRHLLWSAALTGVLLLPLLSASLPHWGVRGWDKAPMSSAPLSVIAAPALPDVGGTLPVTNPVTTGDPAPAEPRSVRPRRIPWASIGLAVWAIGTFSVLAHLALGLSRVGRTKSTAHALTLEELSLLDMAREPLGLRRRVEVLRATGGITVPVTWGVFQPSILLPAQSAAWSAECLRAVFLHELAHVQRWDWATQVTAHLACALYWWHPLVWWAARRARAEAECACDDLVLGTGMRPSDYARRLVEVARSMPAGTHSPTVAVAMAHPSEVAGRVQAVLARGRRRGRVARRRAAGLMALVAACVCAAAALNPVAATDTPGAAHNDLHGEVIVIDPGHGGQDTGAVGPGGVMEKTLNLAIAQRLRTALERRGATVFLTREGDTFVDLMERPRLAATDHADYLIGIHCDDRPAQTYGGPGALVYYHGHSLSGFHLAVGVGAGLVRGTGERAGPLPDLTVFSPGGFGVLRGATMPAVLVECGDMAIPADLVRLRDPQSQQQIAEGIADGLSAFHNAPSHFGIQPHADPPPAHAFPARAATITGFQTILAQSEASCLYAQWAWRKADSNLTEATRELIRGTVSDQQYSRALDAVVAAESRRASAQAQLMYLRQKYDFLVRVRLAHPQG